MLKRLHLLTATLLLAGVAQAQVLNVSGNRVLKDFPRGQRTALMTYEQSPRFARYNAPRRAPIEVDTDRQLWWGYHPDYVSSGTSMGPNATGTVWAAISIPTSEKMAKGKNIKGVRIGLKGVSHLKNVHLWVAESLPKSLDDVLLDVPVDAATLVNEDFTEVELPELYPVPNRTLYVGYCLDIAEVADGSGYPIILLYNGANLDNSCWANLGEVTNNQWTDQYKAYGPIAMQVLLDGDFPHNAVAVEPEFLDVFALPDGSAEATITLTSKGLGKVSSIDYFIDYPNYSSDEMHLDFEPFEGMNAQKTVSIPVKADDKPGRSLRSITITMVNGVDNYVEDATTDGFCVTLSRAVTRRTVIEEFTGTWCGWCPRGITGLEKVNELMGDRAITIAVHDSDPMEIDYGASSGAGYPSAYVDRVTVCDPYFGVDESQGLWGLAAERNKVLAEASVDVLSPVLNKSGNVTFKTNVCFNYTYTKSTYALGYVILADGLTGSGRKWAQANYYCLESVRDEWKDYADLAQWINGQSYMPLTYDHVAIAAKGMDGGIEKSIKASIKDGDTITVSGSIALTGNTVLQNMENLKVVSVLFNTATGTIVNADVQPVTVAADFAVNKAQFKAFETIGAIKGSEAKVSVPAANFGSAGLKSVEYTVRVNGHTTDTLSLQLTKPITTLGVYENIEFPIQVEAESGVYNYAFTVTGINGTKNEATTGKNFNGTVIAVAQPSKRKTAVEEFTGTWCMWCPRGLAGLKRARAEYPDDAVLMSIHGGSSSEPMLVSAFNTLLNSVSGFPSANVNRYRSVDPYMGELDEDAWGLGLVIEDENSKMVEASVELQQPVLNEETGIIDFTTDVTFQLNRKSAPYLLSYVLVADGLEGEGDDWLQTNYYAYYAGYYDDDPYMKEITEWDVYARVTYNDVAVAGLGVGTGVSGSIKTTVEEGQTQSHTTKFNIKSNKLAQQASELRVIALLYDKTRKVIINADEKVVVPADLSPVRDLNTASGASALERYSLDGKRLAAPARGVTLVRMSDGSVHKQVTR